MAEEHGQHIPFEGLLIPDNHLAIIGAPADDLVVLVLLQDRVELDDELGNAILNADHVQ